MAILAYKGYICKIIYKLFVIMLVSFVLWKIMMHFDCLSFSANFANHFCFTTIIILAALSVTGIVSL